MAKTNTFLLYLAKPDVQRLDDLLSVGARALLDGGKANRTPSTNFADEAILFSFPGDRHPPSWVPLLSAAFSPPTNLFTQSASGLVAFRFGHSIFALCFGHAHSYLDENRTVADFGLKVAVNAILDGNLKSVERSNIGVAIRDLAQSASQRDLRSFGFDDALDLIRKVAGKGAVDGFADQISGSRGLRFSKKIDLTEVPESAGEAFDLYRSNAYKKTAFSVIDFLSPVLDATLEARLDEALLEAIRGTSDEFEITIPEIVSEKFVTFRFENAGQNNFHADLSIELYREGLQDKLPKLSLDDLKNHRVAGYVDHQDKSFQSWSVYRSIVGSIALGGERYALNEGLWYQIGKKIKDAADKNFIRILMKPDKKLRPFKQIIKPVKKNQKTKKGYQTEESYNLEIAQETEYLSLDQKLIKIDEKPGPGMEVCDLLDIKGRRLIHVKKSSRQSSVLSHLFLQGSNAAKMLRQYEPFKAEFINTVKKHYGVQNAKALQTSLNTGERWTVEFQIADYPRKNGEHSIPFFSKLTLREETRNIEGREFNVRMGFITLARIVP